MAVDESGDRSTPELRPPGAAPGADDVPPYRRVWIWLALAVVLAAGLAVILILPAMVPLPGEQTTAVHPQPGAAGDVVPAGVEPRAEAERTLQAYLRARARLEVANAPAWAGPDWDEASAIVARGDRLFGQRDFAEAADAYARALEVLEQLEDGKFSRLAAALEAGRVALAADDGEAAVAGFELALAIDPDHADAADGLARARVRSTVLGLVADAGEAEEEGDLEGAREAFAAAVALDAVHRPALDGLERVTARIDERRFREALARSFAAIDSGRLDEAGHALDVAARIRAADPAVGEARQRLATARRRAELARLRRGAEASARDEDWQGAAVLYKRALVVADSAAFARQGLERARERVRLHEQLDHYLADPARLSSPGPLANAEQLLASAGSAPANEPALAAKIRELADRVEKARVPLPVVLRSDGNTEVVIYKVGRLGRFDEKSVELRPGTYTAVGSRAGYRDVQRVFTVSPGAPPPPLMVRCTEPI